MANSFQSSVDLILKNGRSDDNADMKVSDILNLLEFSIADSLRESPDIFRDISALSRELKWTSVPVIQASEVEIVNDHEPLGSGTSFTVFKGLLKREKKLVAVKRLNNERLLGTSMIEIQKEKNRGMLLDATLELRTLMHPWFRSHPNIVNLIAVFWENFDKTDTGTESSVFPVLVVELADEAIPTLYCAIRNNSTAFSQTDRFLFLEDVAEGLTISHSSRLIHGDIKPENVLMFWNGRRFVCKVCDFGFSRPSVDGNVSIGGTFYWNAPECCPQSPESYRPYAGTITRDLYSFGLLMWFVLFLELPFGEYGIMTEDELVSQKLHVDAGSITIRLADRLRCKILEPDTARTMNTVLTPASKDGLLWWQIHGCMVELYKTQPNARNIALGEIHYVLRTPESVADAFSPDVIRRKESRYIRQEGTRGSLRPFTVAPFAKTEMVSAAIQNLNDAYYLEELPLEVQKSRFHQAKSKLDLTASEDPSRPELLSTLASFYVLGIGVEQNITLAYELELEAAKLGLTLAQLFVMNLHFKGDFDLDIEADTMKSWILKALVFYQDKTHSKEAEVGRKVEKLLIGIPEPHLGKSLVHIYKSVWMREFRIVDKEWYSSSAQDVLNHICEGDLVLLQQKLQDNSSLLKLKADGSSLIHIAAEQCQAEIIHYLLTEQGVSPDDPNDEGNTPFEIAALKGSLECCLMLLASGASPNTALSQALFTSVAMTGGRMRLKADNATDLRRSWHLLDSLIIDAKFALTNMLTEGTIETTSTPETIESELVNGLFHYTNRKSKESLGSRRNGEDTDTEPEEESEQFSPLQYALSIANYNTAVALLALGADPDVFRNEYPPLHLAVLTQQPYLVAQLLARGADPDIRDIKTHDEATPLHVANSFSPSMFYMPNYLHVIDHSQSSPITTVKSEVKSREEEVEDIEKQEAAEIQLLEFGGDLSSPDVVVSMIHLLVNAGADIHALNSEGYTPLALAKKYDDEVATQALKAIGAIR